MQATTWPPTPEPTNDPELQATVTSLEAMVEALTLQQLEGDPQ